jgi:RNA polymerase sigma factor (TIGR02999 family)
VGTIPTYYKTVVKAPVPQPLERLRAGDESLLDQFTKVLYDELRRIARRQLRGERSEHTLQTTALVHEAYLRLCGSPQRQFADRSHFLAVAARVMRQVLVDYARGRATRKRRSEELGVHTGEPGTERVQLLDLHGALNALEKEDEWLARIVEMNYFGGMTAEEVAEATTQSVHAVRHDLQFAQAWLRRRLQDRRNPAR